MRIRTYCSVLALACMGALAACSGGPPHPSGWEPVPGANPVAGWTTGSGDAEQEYDYVRKPFTGTLQDLASQQAVDVVLHRHGSKFINSDTFGSCPGLAAVATFSAGKNRTLMQGFALQNGQAVLVTYVRPANTAIDPAVTAALERALCVAAL